MNIIFTSCGNDSIALYQWAIESGLDDLHAAYSNTQWSSKEWPERVERVKQYVELTGGTFHEIPSEGMRALAKRKKAWPANGMGFCSYELKIKPAMDWMDKFDPDKKAICYTGIMRIESESRKNYPEITKESPNHGERTLICPLAKFSLKQRNALLSRAGFEILKGRSKECSPCINVTLREIQELPERDVIKVITHEEEMGIGERSGKPKYMFRPHRMGGACGMREVKERADHGGGKYSPLQDDMFGCDSGFCG